MVRLTFLLVLALYGILLIIPGRDHEAPNAQNETEGFFASIIAQAEEEAVTPPANAAPSEVAIAAQPRFAALGALEQREGTYLLQTSSGEWIEVSAIIDPSDLVSRNAAAQATVARVDVTTGAVPAAATGGGATAGAETVVAAATEPSIWRVTGSRVNFRAGPSTNDAILTALVAGDRVEFLASAADDWALLRVVSTGLEGYMAARFLEPAN